MVESRSRGAGRHDRRAEVARLRQRHGSPLAASDGRCSPHRRGEVDELRGGDPGDRCGASALRSSEPREQGDAAHGHEGPEAHPCPGARDERHADADEQGEGEVLDRAGADHPGGGDDQQGRAGGQDRAAERLVEGVVGGLVDRLVAVQRDALADAVEDDDGVVDRVADDSKQRRKHGQIELQSKQRKDPERKHHIV